MFVKDWLLPILIGIVAAIALISILYNNPKVKQAFADIGAMMQLNASKPKVIPVIPVIPVEKFDNFSQQHQYKFNSKSNYQTEPFTNMGAPIELENRESYDAKLWNPLPSQYSCTSENKNESDISNVSNPLNILNNPNSHDIYNYYPQITNKL